MPNPKRGNAASRCRRRKWTYHEVRKWIHLGCFLVFLALPFFNVMRFDLPRQRFYFAGFELWISEFAILFFTLLFLLFVIVAMALIYGRIYCGYLCPQTIFSEAAQWWEARVNRQLKRRWAGAPAGAICAWRAGDLAGGRGCRVGVSGIHFHFLFRGAARPVTATAGRSTCRQPAAWRAPWSR